MTSITLRPAKLEQDFGRIAELFSLEQTEPVSEPDLKQDFAAHRERILRLMVAEDERGQFMGFNWLTRSRFDPHKAYFFLIVASECRRQGAGKRLYADLEQTARRALLEHLQVDVRDACPEYAAFAKQRGFSERSHFVGLELDLDAFQFMAYNDLLDKLKGERFQFTSMAELGNTQEAQRKLYRLNDSTNMELVVPDGEHTWLSFDDFRKKVCQMNWYDPAGQMLVIDTVTGTWAAMSAITRYAGSDHAVNLHTGVDRRYHRRGLAQAVLVTALRYAREELKVSRALADENAQNVTSLAIYRQLGYTQVSGMITMVKALK